MGHLTRIMVRFTSVMACLTDVMVPLTRIMVCITDVMVRHLRVMVCFTDVMVRVTGVMVALTDIMVRLTEEIGDRLCALLRRTDPWAAFCPHEGGKVHLPLRVFAIPSVKR